MRTLFLILVLASCSAKLQPSKNTSMDELYVEGLKRIRHDAICQGKFAHAHKIKKEIKQLKQHKK